MRSSKIAEVALQNESIRQLAISDVTNFEQVESSEITHTPFLESVKANSPVFSNDDASVPKSSEEVNSYDYVSIGSPPSIDPLFQHHSNTPSADTGGPDSGYVPIAQQQQVSSSSNSMLYSMSPGSGGEGSESSDHCDDFMTAVEALTPPGSLSFAENSKQHIKSNQYDKTNGTTREVRTDSVSSDYDVMIDSPKFYNSIARLQEQQHPLLNRYSCNLRYRCDTINSKVNY